MKQTLNFLLISITVIVILPWVVFKYIGTYIGEAVELANQAWRESNKL